MIYTLCLESFCTLKFAIQKVETFWASGWRWRRWIFLGCSESKFPTQCWHDRIWNIYIISKCFFPSPTKGRTTRFQGVEFACKNYYIGSDTKKTSIVRPSSTLNKSDDHVKSQIGCRFWIVVLSWYRGHLPHPVLVDTPPNINSGAGQKNSSSLSTVFVTLAYGRSKFRN